MFLLLSALLLAAPKTPAWAPPQDQIATYNEAVDSYNTGDLQEALVLLDQILLKQPECGAARALRASLLLRQGKGAEALPELEALAKLHPKEQMVWLSLSEAAFAVQSFPRSLEAAQEALRLGPGDFAAHRALNLALVRLGRYDEALDALKQARNRGVDAADLACLEVRILADQRQMEEAKEKLSTCEGSRDLNLVRSSRTFLASVAGDYQAAAEGADAVGAEGLSRQNRATQAALSGDYEGCIQQLNEVLSGDPQNAGARLQRANCLHASEQNSEARADLEGIFKAETWVSIQTNGSLSGIITHGAESEFRAYIAKGALLLVQLELEDGDLKAAEATYTTMKQSFGDVDATAAAAACLAAGSKKDPWPPLQAAFQSFPTSQLLVEVSGALLLDNPRGVPAEVVEALLKRGSWAEHYNLGAWYFNEQQFPECLAVAEPALQGLEGPSRALLYNLIYSCAAGAEDLARLDQTLLALGSSSGLHPGALLQHAWLRAEANRTADARPLWEQACASPPSDLSEACRQVGTRIK